MIQADPVLRTVVAATDLSEPAMVACHRAAQLAHAHGASLSLVHMVTLGLLDRLRLVAADDAEQVEGLLLAALAADVQAVADDLAARYQVKAQVTVERQPIVAGLLSHVAATQADLVVVGPQGAGRVRHAVLGSTAERLVGRCPVPVLVARQGGPAGYRQILVPVDFSPASRAAIEAARRLAPQAQLILMHAFLVPFEGKMKLAGVDDDHIHRYELQARQDAHAHMQALMAECGLDADRVATVVAHGEPTRLILAHADELGVDLIAMGKGQDTVLEELLVGSVTKHVLVEAETDVLVTA